MDDENSQYGNPYLTGTFLGFVLLASFLLLGAGLGASGGLARLAAYIEGIFFPAHTLASEYFGAWGKHPLNYYLVYMLIGIFLGGLFSAVSNKRVSFGLEKGKSASIKMRTVFALAGGILVGFASRLAGGCTSGQALTGGALLLTGSIALLICVFAGGYAAAFFVRRQWND